MSYTDEEISRAARQLRREWESPELWPRIQAALAAEAARIERRRAPSRVSAWLTLAAAAVLVFGVTVVLRVRTPQAGAPPAEAEHRLLLGERRRSNHCRRATSRNASSVASRIRASSTSPTAAIGGSSSCRRRSTKRASCSSRRSPSVG